MFRNKACVDVRATYSNEVKWLKAVCWYKGAKVEEVGDKGRRERWPRVKEDRGDRVERGKERDGCEKWTRRTKMRACGWGWEGIWRKGGRSEVKVMTDCHPLPSAPLIRSPLLPSLKMNLSHYAVCLIILFTPLHDGIWMPRLGIYLWRINLSSPVSLLSHFLCLYCFFPLYLTLGVFTPSCLSLPFYWSHT